MNKPNLKPNTLWTGDNLPIMRGMNSACIDLVYLDPPFNSNVSYSAPIGSRAAGAAFKDTWNLSDVDKAWLGEIAEKNPGLHAVVRASGMAHGSGMQSYLTMMAVRLMEIRRIVKPTGSVWLHCDPTASHYLKLMMDAIFGKKNFMSDIVWCRAGMHHVGKTFDTVSDTLLFYAANKEEATFNPPFSKLGPSEMAMKFPYIEKETARRYQHRNLEQSANKSSAGETRTIGKRVMVSEMGWRWSQKTFDERLAKNPHVIYWTKPGRPRYKIYADEYPGRAIGNIWMDVPFLASGSKERTGYPTQKPLSLLKRIIESSSNPGDLILDPFCGCATALVAARNSMREWVGIDLSELAQKLVRMRMDRGMSTYGQIHMRTDLPIRDDGDKVPSYKTHKHTFFGEQEGRCRGCLYFFDFRNMTIDHIIPKVAGGSDHPSNLQLLCPACNSKKGPRTMEHLITELVREGIRIAK